MPGDADFTPNPRRAIRVEGRIDEALLERLRPQIIELTAQSREPITVFINSRGGFGEVGSDILRVLRRTTEDDARVSRIITVAMPTAQSAAANLLSAGDFAIAFSDSSLMYHGARFLLPEKGFTGELGKLAQELRTYRGAAAAELAISSERRFLFIVSAMRALFAERRAERGDPTLTDLECFQAILRGKLSPVAGKVLDLAIHVCSRFNDLMFHFRKRLRRGRTVTNEHLQKLMLHASIAFEYENRAGAPAWDGGLGEISDNFFFLNAYFDFARLREWVAGRAEPQTSDADPEAAYFLEFRVFFLALCRALQEGENHITAMDAVWLGLTDTLGRDV
jgi:ATP-dependent protease ClpP protease subunit